MMLGRTECLWAMFNDGNALMLFLGLRMHRCARP
jgi:hypothetical protein